MLYVLASGICKPKNPQFMHFEIFFFFHRCTGDTLYMEGVDSEALLKRCDISFDRLVDISK